MILKPNRISTIPPTVESGGFLTDLDLLNLDKLVLICRLTLC